MREEIKYLDFVMCKEGIKPDIEKVEAIRSMAAPTTVTEVRSFIGICASTIADLSRNPHRQQAEPIIALTKKYARFHWSEDCQRDFEHLKESPTIVPLLAHPDHNKPYVLYTDASDTCNAACLTQESKDECEFACGTKIEKPIYFPLT